MPLKIIRNDITTMCVDAIVNTANDHTTVGSGCDYAIYRAAGHDELLKYRTERIGFVPEGDAFITPGFKLNCKHIIHAVSPLFIDGESGEEEKLRSCYKKSFQIALENEVKSIAFPLISTGGFGYPKEEGFRIAVDEIHAFLMKHDMLVYLVVFDNKATSLSRHLDPGLESYIDQNYVEAKYREEYYELFSSRRETAKRESRLRMEINQKQCNQHNITIMQTDEAEDNSNINFYEEHENALEERIKHISDTFSEYLIYLIDSRGMNYPDVYKRAIVDKKVFSKIKNNPNAHPKKITAMCLCVGAKLNMDQTRDLLARAGYALSPCDKTDIIFSYFIENQIYDMIELDIQLEEHGLPCLIS